MIHAGKHNFNYSFEIQSVFDTLNNIYVDLNHYLVIFKEQSM